MAVVLELFDRLLEIVHRAMASLLGWTRGVLLRVPSLSELLDRRNIDVAVMELSLDLGPVASDEASILMNRIAGERRFPLLGVLRDVASVNKFPSVR